MTMVKLGLVARITLIVIAALFLIQIVAIFGYGWDRMETQQRQAPLPERLLPAVRLLDHADWQTRALFVETASKNGMPLSILQKVPDTFNEDVGLARFRIAIARELANMGLTDRLLVIGRNRHGEEQPLTVGDPANGIQVLIGLASGEIAAFDVHDPVTVRIGGIPIGFFGGLLGFIVAGIAIFAVFRETRPLSALSRSVESIGSTVRPIILEEKGARELRNLIRAINAMQERISALVNNRTLIIGAISHDLKTYLTRLRLRVEMMPDNDYRERAVTDIEAMQVLLSDALSFARTSFNHNDVPVIDLAATVAQCVREHPERASAITIGTMTTALPVRIDGLALRRVIDNLLGNAIRYGERVTIRVERQDGMAVLQMDDEGPGIPAPMLEAVFEPFFRAEQSRNLDRGGSGLGLTIVKQIVEGHQGTTTLTNRPEGGLRVRVHLPLIDG